MSEMENLIGRCGLKKKEVIKLASYIAEGKLTKREKKMLNGYVMEAKFKDHKNKKSFFSAKSSEDGLFLSHSEYTDSSSIDGAVVLLDTYYKELEIRVWADKNKEDYTHLLSMSGAKKSLRQKRKIK